MTIIFTISVNTTVMATEAWGDVDVEMNKAEEDAEKEHNKGLEVEEKKEEKTEKRDDGNKVESKEDEKRGAD
jgi:hypothetical protein